MGNKKWTEEEIEFLKENYNNITYNSISKSLKKSKSSISNKINRLILSGILIYPKKRIFFKKWDKDLLKQEILKLKEKLNHIPTYKEGGKIALSSVRYFGSWNNALRYCNLEIKKEKKHKILNENFNKLTPEKAYILGVLCGDGCVVRNRIKLNVIDKEFAEYFAYCLEMVYGIKTKMSEIRTPNRVKNSIIYRCKNQWVVTLNSKEAYEDILKYGNLTTFKWVVPNEIYKNEDKNIISNFLKGYIDSEGCISIRKRGASIQVSSSNINGLKQIFYLLNNLDINSKLHINGKSKCLSITYPHNQKKFMDNIGFTILRKKVKLGGYLKNFYDKNSKKIEDYNKVLKLSRELSNVQNIKKELEKNGKIYDLRIINGWVNQEIIPLCCKT